MSATRIPTAIVVSIGEEVIGGDIVDSNAAALAQRLRALGIAVRGFRAVGDVEADIAEALRGALAAADVVVTTGGLGPTRDDLTRGGLALALGDPLIEDPVALEQVRATFERLGRKMSESNRLQAQRPASAEIVVNPVGTAPGMCAMRGGSVLFSLPGVPFEMKRMFDDSVAPRLTALGLATGAPPRRRLRCHGIAESVAGERIAEFMGEGKDPYVGVTVSGGVLTVSVRSAHATDAASRQVDAIAEEIAKRLGDDVFGREDATLESAVIELARAKRRRFVVVESCTGGSIAAALTAVPGSSEVFLGGVIAYANEVKESLADVPRELLIEHGAVSAEVACALATGIARRFGTDLAVSATGIAGPGGGTDRKPVGLVYLGLRDGAEVSSKEVRFLGDREAIRLRATRVGLDLLRRALIRGI